MKQALEALEDIFGQNKVDVGAINALRAAIDEADHIGDANKMVEPEWDEVFDAAVSAYCRSDASKTALRMCFQSRNERNQISVGWTANELMDFASGIASIYTHPPRLEWVGLTDEAIREVHQSIDWGEIGCAIKFARAIEAKLKEKNS